MINTILTFIQHNLEGELVLIALFTWEVWTHHKDKKASLKRDALDRQRHSDTLQMLKQQDETQDAIVSLLTIIKELNTNSVRLQAQSRDDMVDAINNLDDK